MEMEAPFDGLLVILHWCTCGADGRSFVWVVGVRSRDYQIFLEWVDLLTHGALLACATAPLLLLHCQVR